MSWAATIELHRSRCSDGSGSVSWSSGSAHTCCLPTLSGILAARAGSARGWPLPGSSQRPWDSCSSSGGPRPSFGRHPAATYGVPGQGSPYFVPPQSRLGPRGELFVRFWVGIGFLVVSVLKAAAPRPGHLPGDPSGNPGFWELIGFLTAVIGSAILSSALIKVRVLRDR
jgi:hypothetical protein